MKKAKKERLKKIVNIIILIITLLLLLTYDYLRKNVTYSSFDQLLFSIQTSSGTSKDVVMNGVTYVLINFLIVFISLIIIKIILNKYITFKKEKIYLVINFLKIKLKIKLYPINKTFFLLLFFIVSYGYILFFGLGIKDYLYNKRNKSNLYEKYYVNPKKAKINFYDKKKNLIFIYVESLENSAMSIESGGLQEKSFIPNLEKMAKENTNFSSTDNLGGFLTPGGTTWTVGAMVGQTAGIPLRTGKTDANSYVSDNFLSGAYSLGDILEDNGYKNYIMLGSDAAFGGRKYYFEQHGNYEILDHNWAKKEKLIPEDYSVWWGYEDLKLFSFAKDKLKDISKNNEPFNFTILTADTHFTDGYQDDTCKEEFKNNKYANAYYCNDKKIKGFIDWIKKQDFYDNTTIVITGDHLTMQKDYFVSEDEDYTRVVYNVIINGPSVDLSRTKNRNLTTFDIFPTTLASVGASIDGDRLGFGTNLYSNKNTLTEELGFDNFNNELGKDSDYYNHRILGGDYIKLNN